ncbi:hypothetical protein [Streptomyces sp. NPDC094032]
MSATLTEVAASSQRMKSEIDGHFYALALPGETAAAPAKY